MGREASCIDELGLLKLIRMSDQDLKTLALGTDLTLLGLNLNSPDVLFPSFQSPWADAPLRPKEPPFQLYVNNFFCVGLQQLSGGWCSRVDHPQATLTSIRVAAHSLTCVPFFSNVVNVAEGPRVTKYRPTCRLFQPEWRSNSCRMKRYFMHFIQCPGM